MNRIWFNYLECGGENVKQQKWECHWWLYEKDIYGTGRGNITRGNRWTLLLFGTTHRKKCVKRLRIGELIDNCAEVIW